MSRGGLYVAREPGLDRPPHVALSEHSASACAISSVIAWFCQGIRASAVL